jgi:hypothetical protein
VTPTNFRKPRTGERKLRVRFRNGQVSRWTYRADQMRWTDTGDDYDIVACELGGKHG